MTEPRLFEGDRTIWCVVCHHAHDVTPVGTPPERCRACLGGGDWWTRNAPRMELDQVNETIERMKRARPTCDKDELRPFTASLSEPDGPEGFTLDPNFAGYRKRCPACASGKLFPWADKLDSQRVLEFVNTDPRCKSMFALDILKETLPAYYQAIDRTLEAMFAYQLAGSEEGARELLAKVGSTDICMRRNCIDARAEGLADCVCKPGDKAFFQELPGPGPEIRVPVELAQPYRTFLITGILPSECPKCGALDCTKNHAEFM